MRSQAVIIEALIIVSTLLFLMLLTIPFHAEVNQAVKETIATDENIVEAMLGSAYIP